MITKILETKDCVNLDISQYIEEEKDIIIDGMLESDTDGWADQVCYVGLEANSNFNKNTIPLLMNYRDSNKFHKVVYVTHNLNYKDSYNFFDQIIYLTDTDQSSLNTIKKKYYTKNNIYLKYYNSPSMNHERHNVVYTVDKNTQSSEFYSILTSDSNLMVKDRQLDLSDLKSKMTEFSEDDIFTFGNGKQSGVVMFKANNILTKDTSLILFTESRAAPKSSCYFYVNNNAGYDYAYSKPPNKGYAFFRSGRKDNDKSQHRVLYTMDLDFKDPLGLFDVIVYVSDKKLPVNNTDFYNPTKESYFTVDYSKNFWVKSIAPNNKDKDAYDAHLYSIKTEDIYNELYKLPFQTTDVFYNGLINDEWKADENIQGSYVKPVKIIEQKYSKNYTYNSIYINNHTLPEEYRQNHWNRSEYPVPPTFIYKKIKGLKSGCNYRVKFKIRANYIYDLTTKERDDTTNYSRYAVNFVGSFVECKHEYLTTSDEETGNAHDYVSIVSRGTSYRFDINSKYIKCNLPDNSYTEVEANFKKDSMDEYFDYNMYLLIPNYLESHTNSSNSKAPSFLYIEIKDFIIENLDEDKLLTFGTKNELTKDNITWETDSKGPVGELNSGLVKTIDKDGYQFSFSFGHNLFYQYGYYDSYQNKPFLFTNLNLKPNTRYTLYMNVTHKNVPNNSCILMIKYGSSTLTSKGNYVNKKYDHSDPVSGRFYNYDVEHWMSFRTDETGKVTIGFAIRDFYNYASEIYIKDFSYKEINETINDNHFTQPKLNENIKQTDNLIIYRNHIVNSLFRRTKQIYRLTAGFLTDLTKKHPITIESRGYGIRSYTSYPEGVVDTTFTDYLICNRINTIYRPNTSSGGSSCISNDTYIDPNSAKISSNPNIDDYYANIDDYSYTISRRDYPDGYYQFQLITSASRKSKYSAYSREKLAELYKGYLQLMDGKNDFDFKSYGLDRMTRFNFVGYKDIDTSPVGFKHPVYTTDESEGFVKILMIKASDIEALMTK